MRVESRNDRIRVTASGKTCDLILGDGWERTDETPQPLGTDEWPTLHDRVVDPSGDVELPAGGVGVIDAEGQERRLSRDDTEIVDPAETIVSYGPVPTLVRPSAAVEVRFGPSDVPTVSLESDATLSVAWWRPPEAPLDEISIDPTQPESVATGVAAASTALPSVETPGRTWPNGRTAAPRLTTDGGGRDPESVDRIDTGVEFVLPDSLEHVLAVSSLVYYLGADVAVADDATEARLHAGGDEWTLGSDPETVDTQASSWLRRVFYLDCLARCGGPNDVRMLEADAALEHVDGTADELFETALDERVARYLAADDAVTEELPQWPEVVHVAADNPRERVPRLSRYLGRLADVQLPDGDRLSVGELSTWDPEPGVAVRGTAATVPNMFIVPTSDGETGAVGWDAPGTPLGAYDASVGTPPAPTRRDDDPVEVVIVRCGWESAGDAAARWRERADDLAMTVTTQSNPTVDGLREILRRNVDVVHLAAHNESNEGVECADGHLPRYELREVGASVVVANCCDSERWARQAVTAGSSAAVGTTGPIKTRVAEREGADIAGLLSLGWCVERAVDMVRSVRDPSGWLVVGDGGVRVGQSHAPIPAWVSTSSDGASISHLAPGAAGYRVTDVADCGPRLPGVAMSEIDPETLFGRLDSPVQTDEQLVWNSSEF